MAPGRHAWQGRPRGSAGGSSRGVVTLTGIVRDGELIPLIVRLAAGTDGVISVVDQLSCGDELHVEP